MKTILLFLIFVFIGTNITGCAKKVNTAQQIYEYQRANDAAAKAHKELNRE